MTKSATLIVSALMSVGLAAGAMAANAPKTMTTVSADAPAATGGATDAPKHTKKHKKHKKSKAAPSTTK